jgi:DNA-binding transcriptional regulator YhcF (GntR family)
VPDFKAWASDLDDRQPIYLQIVDRFRENMATGEMQPGNRVPSIRDVASGMRVNPNTVNRAYQEMERQGLIYSQRGMGYYVSEDVEKMQGFKSNMAREVIDRFLKDMQSMGFTPEEIIKTLREELSKQTVEEGDDNG